MSLKSLQSASFGSSGEAHAPHTRNPPPDVRTQGKVRIQGHFHDGGRHPGEASDPGGRNPPPKYREFFPSTQGMAKIGFVYFSLQITKRSLSMADALMHWDEKQKRWRAMHRGRRLQISVKKLGGANRAETTTAANQWFREQQARIDTEKAVETIRPNELEYRAELKNIQEKIKVLEVVMRDPNAKSTIAPIVENLKRRASRIEQALRQPELPPLDDSLRDPLDISPRRIEEEASKKATQIVADQLRNITGFDKGKKPYEDTDDFGLKVLKCLESRFANQVREEQIQTDAEGFVGLKDELLDQKKAELELIDEFDRGTINQMLKEQGVVPPENRQLDHNIDKFTKAQERRLALGEISAGRLAKIVNTIKSYRDWTRIKSVDKFGTKSHIDDYYGHLANRVIEKEIKPKYANDLFSTFKMMFFWFVDEEILKEKEYSNALQRKGNKYSFKVPVQTAEVIDLVWIHKILDAAKPRLRLCILLTLNCGFGASEIGQLTKDRYDTTTGRITHKRFKTAKSKKVPTVCYKLWDETKEALDREIANRNKYPQRDGSSKLLLVNGNGNPLWSERFENEKGKKNDNITNDFKHLLIKLRETEPDIPKIAYYQFRKTAASLIYNEPQYRLYNELWLGHAPQSVADKFYNAPEDTILDACIDWLHDKIFGETPQFQDDSHPKRKKKK